MSEQLSGGYEQEPQPVGAQWLEVLGRTELLGKETNFTHPDNPNEIVLFDNFDVLCRGHAGAIFARLQATPSSHPDHERMIRVAGAAFQKYFDDKD